MLLLRRRHWMLWGDLLWGSLLLRGMTLLCHLLRDLLLLGLLL